MIENSLTVIPTYSCNYSCAYCWQKFIKNDKVLSLNKLKFQLLTLKKMGIKTYGINIMGGELSMLPNFEDYINLVLEFNDNIRFTTNLTLNSDQIKFLSTKDNVTVYGSLHMNVITKEEIIKTLKVFSQITNNKVLDVLGQNIHNIDLPEHNKIEITPPNEEEQNSVFENNYSILPEGDILLNDEVLKSLPKGFR